LKPLFERGNILLQDLKRRDIAGIAELEDGFK
jgi:hypothetical protein